MNRVLLSFPLQRGLTEQMDWRRFQNGGSMVAIDDALEGADTPILTSLADASANLVGRSSDRTEAPALP